MKDIEKKIKKYLKERKWDNLRPGDMAKSVAIESGELLEIFQWDNPTLAETKKDKERLGKIKKELADVLIYCLDISVSLGFDTQKIIEEKLEYVRQKYPVDVFKNRKKKPGSKDVYWKIKNEYRRSGKS